MLSRLHFGQNSGNTFNSVSGKSCKRVFAPHTGHKTQCFSSDLSFIIFTLPSAAGAYSVNKPIYVRAKQKPDAVLFRRAVVNTVCKAFNIVCRQGHHGNNLTVNNLPYRFPEHPIVHHISYYIYSA